MLIALLAVLGVDLIVIVALVAFLLARKRWVGHQPGAFKGVIRVADGEVDGLKRRWTRGYGRWVRDVLVWTKAPLLFRNALMPADALRDRRAARPDEVKRLGDTPVVVRLTVGAATVEVAGRGEDVDRLLGPYRSTRTPAGGVTPAPSSSTRVTP
jgi:hypothetical protein